MIDPKLIKKEPNAILASLQKRGKYILAQYMWTVMQLNSEINATITKVDKLRAERNRIASEFAILKKANKDTKALHKEAEDNNKRIENSEIGLKEKQKSLRYSLMQIPNLLHKDVPKGEKEKDNLEIKVWPKGKVLKKKGKTHIQIAKTIDLARGVKLSGPRFAVLMGQVATLERAIGNFFIDFHVANHGYKEAAVPYIVKREILEGTGQLPKFENDLFVVNKDMFLIPTAEVPLTNIYRDEIIPEENLPIKMVALTPCFRAEAGAAGKDIKGIIRQHQFNKVEMVCITKPEDSDKHHAELLGHAEAVLEELGLPYRTVLHCGGETSFSASKCYDIEVWLPSQNKYREISSVSQFGDFQARRANIKYKGKKKGQRSKLVNTLNGSGLAVGRTLVAILEHYVQDNGTVLVPKALVPYTKFDKIEF